MNQRPTTLFVDIGGVLLTNGWDRSARKLASETFGLDEDELNERHHLTFDTYEAGKLSLDEYLDRVVFHQKRNFGREKFKEFMFTRSSPYPEMLELLARVKARNRLKVVAVSNEGRELAEYRVREFGLNSLVDFFVVSSFVYYRKPDKDIYRIALDIAQADPSQVVYIDDRSMFVEVAGSLGIKGIWHRGAGSTRDSLAASGLPADS